MNPYKFLFDIAYERLKISTIISFTTSIWARKTLPSGKGVVWKKMYYFFQLHNEEFLGHYHKRSNVESTVNMIKSKFGDSVRSKTWTAQINEVLCKIICHNLCCVIMKMHTLGIKADFDRKVIEVSEKSGF